MGDLQWKEWLPIEGCIKTEGTEAIWFINPTTDEKWYLVRVRKLDKLIRPERVGTFSTQQEAMDNAQKMENAGIH